MTVGGFDSPEFRDAARPSPCHCLCARWRQRGVCTGRAATARNLGQSRVPLCVPCAEDIDRQRPRSVPDE